MTLPQVPAGEPVVQPHVFTIGHGARSIQAFIAVLHEASVTLLVDIRRFPGSRRHPQFGRSALASALDGAGIGYEWQGEALGGRRSRIPGSRHIALREAAFAGYADHMDTPSFRSAAAELVSRADRERLAVMCAETVWWHCHRMLLSDALVMRGATVTHLLDVGRWQDHRPHPTVRNGEDGWPIYDVPDTIPGLE